MPLRNKDRTGRNQERTMPLSHKDTKMERAFERRYGKKKGERRYYATLNARINEGRPINSPESRKLARKRRRHS